MTLTSATNRVQYSGDGATVSFPVTFVFWDADDLQVILTSSAGVETTWVRGTQYTVSGGSGSTGTVTVDTSPTDYTPASGTTLTIKSNLSDFQNTDLAAGGPFPASSVEQQLDKIVRLVQQKAEALGRAIKLRASSTYTNITMPEPSANKVVGWNSGGTDLENKTANTSAYVTLPSSATNGGIVTFNGTSGTSLQDSTYTITAAGAALIDDANAAAQRTTLGLGTAAVKNAATGSGDLLPTDGDGSGLSGIATIPSIKKYIQGLTYANNGSDATNDIDIAVGSAVDATGAKLLTLASALTKQSDVAWAAGTNAGGLDTGAVGNNDYYIWLIMRSDTGVVDVLFSLSSTAPTMPASYDYKRLIGWFKRSAGAILAFNTYELEGGGLEFLWSSLAADINLPNTLTTTEREDAVKVPLNFSVEAIINFTIHDATTAGYAAIYCPDVPSNTSYNHYWNTAGATPYFQLKVRTSATGTIAAIASVATVDTYAASTAGFKWGRRN